MPSTSTDRFASNKQSLAEDNHRIPSTSYPISFTTTYWGRVGSGRVAARPRPRPSYQMEGKNCRATLGWAGRGEAEGGSTLVGAERRGRRGDGAARATGRRSGEGDGREDEARRTAAVETLGGRSLASGVGLGVGRSIDGDLVARERGSKGIWRGRGR